jgi:hypothetical protein
VLRAVHLGEARRFAQGWSEICPKSVICRQAADRWRHRDALLRS